MVLEGVKKFGDLIEAEKSFLFGSLISMLSYDLLRGTTVIEKQTVYYIMKVSGPNHHSSVNMGSCHCCTMLLSNDVVMGKGLIK